MPLKAYTKRVGQHDRARADQPQPAHHDGRALQHPRQQVPLSPSLGVRPQDRKQQQAGAEHGGSGHRLQCGTERRGAVEQEVTGGEGHVRRGTSCDRTAGRWACWTPVRRLGPPRWPTTTPYSAACEPTGSPWQRRGTPSPCSTRPPTASRSRRRTFPWGRGSGRATSRPRSWSRCRPTATCTWSSWPRSASCSRATTSATSSHSGST